MAFSDKIKLILRSSPIVRTLVIAAVAGGSLFISLIIGRKVYSVPRVYSIDPQVGSPGDIMILKGESFGDVRDKSYVSIAGSRITESGYIKWSDTEIKVSVPVNVRDGLVVVGTMAGTSEPIFFANESGIPVIVRTNPETTVPAIIAISSTASIGSVVTISGKNFGAVRGNSRVYFAANREDVLPEQNASLSYSMESFYIPANEADNDYLTWSDSEIEVRVPDGAVSGPVFVKTDKGESDTFRLNVDFKAGKKSFHNKRTYVLQQSAVFEAKDLSGQQGMEMITLYSPKPAVSASQPSVILDDCVPEPYIKDDLRNMIFQNHLSPLLPRVQRYSQSYVIGVYSVSANINPKKIEPYRDVKSVFYKTCTSADACVPSNNELIITLAKTITGNEKNPYAKARLIYNYMLEKYTIENTVRKSDASPLDLLRRKTGDAYDFAVIYTALCRASSIPALPVSGLMVEKDSSVIDHWWTELYFEGYGWFPVDTALAAGLQFEAFIPVENPAEYYFGNCDSQHISFSRGWNQIRSSFTNNQVVTRPRTYALQSIWEETVLSASSGVQKSNVYTCTWKRPVITGIY